MIEKRNRINGEIDCSEVRLIAPDGANIGVVDIEKARGYALEHSLDLVELMPNTQPPVCRLLDYGKFKFEQRKKEQRSRKNQKRMQVKEVKFRPNTETMDYETKLRSLIKFLREGDKTKVVLRFRGREIMHRDLGMQILYRIEEDLREHGIVEQEPKTEGRQVVMVYAPKRS